MAYLRVPVECCSCKKTVDKALTRKVDGLGNDYECFTCCKLKGKVRESNQKIKRQLYCQKCNYKFNSTKYSCPYCSNIDFVMEGEVSVQDLL